MQKIKVLLVFLLLFPLQALAIELEDAPDKDVGDIDRAAEAFSVQDIKLIKLVKIDANPELDGILDDAFWRDATQLEIGMELYPERFAEAIVKTQVLVATNDTHIYLVFTAHDPKPEEIYSTTPLRDE
jgi:hypothetical protein